MSNNRFFAALYVAFAVFVGVIVAQLTSNVWQWLAVNAAYWAVIIFLLIAVECFRLAWVILWAPRATWRSHVEATAGES